jgi:hypothetical protein
LRQLSDFGIHTAEHSALKEAPVKQGKSLSW